MSHFTPMPSTLGDDDLSRFREMREQDLDGTMPSIIEFFAEWGKGIEAIALCHSDRDGTLETLRVGASGFSCDRVVLCIDAYIRFSDEVNMPRHDALHVLEADRNPDGPPVIRSVTMPYVVTAGRIEWGKLIRPDDNPSGIIAEALRRALSRPKTIDADIDGVFLSDFANEHFGVDRESSRTYLRAATGAYLMALGTCEVMLAGTDEEREIIESFIQRTTSGLRTETF